MFSPEARIVYILIRLTILFNQDYLLPRVEALNGLIWSKNAGDFVEIFSIHSFEEMNDLRVSISREIETHDFNGTQLKLTAFQIKNLLEFISNNTAVTGIHGEMWELLASMSNFKLNCIRINEYGFGSRSENGSWDGLLGYIYRNETDIIPRSVVSHSRSTAHDFTVALWNEPFRFYMKKQLHYQKTWMAKLFNHRVWFSIIGLFFALSLASFMIHLLNFKEENSPDSIRDLTMRDHFFYVFSILCNQGWTPQRLENRSKIWLFSTRLFSWLLIIAFSSTLISHITQRHYYSPFDNLETFYNNTDYKLVVKRNSFVHSVFRLAPRAIYKEILDARRLVFVDNDDVYEKICTGRYVYIEAQDVVEAESSKLCEIGFVGNVYFKAWIAGGLARGFKYRRSIDLGILKLQEFGIMTRLRSKWLKKSPRMAYSNESMSIKLEHVSLMFAMLCSAVLISLVILLIENIIHQKHPRHRH